MKILISPNGSRVSRRLTERAETDRDQQREEEAGRSIPSALTSASAFRAVIGANRRRGRMISGDHGLGRVAVRPSMPEYSLGEFGKQL